MIGENFTVSDITEESVAAATCQLFYDNVRQVVLRAAHWNSAKTYARLVQKTARDDSSSWLDTDPEPGFIYSYTPPSDMLAARYMADFSMFSLGNDASGKVINSNIGGDATTDAPILCYTKDVTDPTLFEPDLYQAIYSGLAAAIVMPLTGKRARAADLAASANAIILAARANNANEYFTLLQPIPEVLQARGYDYSVPSGYIYPYGALFAGTGAFVT